MVIVVAIAAAIALAAVLQQEFGGANNATPENFRTLKVGASRTQVLAALGAPHEESLNPAAHPRELLQRGPDGFLYASSGFFLGPYSCWVSADKKRQYMVHFENDKAAAIVCIHLDELKDKPPVVVGSLTEAVLQSPAEGAGGMGSEYELQGQVKHAARVK